MSDNVDTPLSQQAAQPSEPPKSWHAPVREVSERVTKLEAATVATQRKLEIIEQKTDAQTVILARLDKVAADPKIRAVVYGLLMLFLAWLAKHGIKVEVPQ